MLLSIIEPYQCILSGGYGLMSGAGPLAFVELVWTRVLSDVTWESDQSDGRINTREVPASRTSVVVAWSSDAVLG